MYAVIHPDSPNYGRILSRHRTYEAALAARQREAEGLRRYSPSSTGVPEREIVRLAPGTRGATRINRTTGEEA